MRFKLNQKAILFVSCLFLILGAPLVSAEEQKETLKVGDSLCCYAYNPNPPNEVKPLFLGDSVPPNWYVYLPDVSSRLTLTKKEGESEASFKEPGVYDTKGLKVKLPSSVRKMISQKGESCQAVRFDAERMPKENKSPEGPLELDDPQKVPSPSS